MLTKTGQKFSFWEKKQSMFNDIIDISHSSYGNIVAIRQTEPREFSTIYACYHMSIP